MRARKRFVVAALSLPLLVGLAACGEVQEAQQGLQEANENLDAVSACMQAINVASFMPNFADPQQAQADAQAKAEELRKLAEQTADQTLRQNLLDVQQSVQQVANGEITLKSSAEWTTAQLEKYQQVTTTCSQIGS
jgi:cobalamin-dependent methionine synthase I